MTTADTRPASNLRWTVRQAGYELADTVVAASPSGAFVQHFVPTRHGLVGRTWIGPDYVQVVLRRPRNQGATYQGSVRAVADGWQAYDDFTGDPAPVGAVHTDYLDAEAVLLRRRTGHRSTADYSWPAAHLRDLATRARGDADRRTAR